MKFFTLFFSTLLFTTISQAQLIVTDEPSATALAQRLVGDGVTISNVTFTGNSLMAGKFRNVGNLTNINLDSGIVLTTGRAKSTGAIFDEIGVDGDGITPAAQQDATTLWNLPGDADLANAIDADVSDLNDACVLEFDFIPSGDTVKFNYVFSSEEYFPGYVCTFNDAFGFFISGPGITGLQNIALIPGTNIPVSIFNVNNVADGGPPNCINNPAYYVDNTNNLYFTHDGHTVVFTAVSAVQPCNVYHLKLVLADFQDAALDTGVFLEAKSLTSNIVTLTNNTQTDILDNSYVVEGCTAGSFTIKRPTLANYPLSVQLTYAGTATNGVDVQTLPSTVVIPANDTIVIVNVIPIIDALPEGIEFIKIYAGAGCASAVPIDSAIIQVRDYDTLTIVPDTAFICRNTSIQLHASSSWSTFAWDPVPGLDNYTIADPVATPPQSSTTYYCTSSVGTCNGRDSAYIEWKQLEFISQVNVNCHNAATGQIIVSGGPEWVAPVQYYLDNVSPQATGTFNNLQVGNYIVHITDGTGCTDSLSVNITQAFPDLLIDSVDVLPASCSATSIGSITVFAGGGLPPYLYSVDGSVFQTDSLFNLNAGTYNITITDANNCSFTLPGVVVSNVNDLNLSVNADVTICAGQSATLSATSTADTYSWQPTNGLSNPAGPTTLASPAATTTYTVIASLGTCQDSASVTVSIGNNLTVEAGGPLTVEAGGSAQVLVVVSGSSADITSIIWTPSEGLSANNILNPVVMPVGTSGTTTYSITVTNSSGCTASDELIVKVITNCINLRNAFTPNGDGINDLWKVYDDFSCLQNVTVHVFNRYGSQVYESDNYKNTWDGRYKGKLLPDGTYYAVVDYKLLSGNVRTVRTDLTILR